MYENFVVRFPVISIPFQMNKKNSFVVWGYANDLWMERWKQSREESRRETGRDGESRREREEGGGVG